MEMIYTVGEFKKLVAESSNEFKPKLGDGVESENKKNNDKSYKDSAKRAKDFDGGLKEPEKKEQPEINDGNKTTMDFNPESVSKEFKERVHAQAKGYTSAAEEKNGIEKEGEFNDATYKALEKQSREMNKNLEDFKKTGLQASKMPEGTFKKEDMYENRKMKTIFFKKTEFINESKMKSRIPDEFKVEGNVFRMKDKNGNSYIVEWVDNDANILEHSDKMGMEKSINRMKDLFNYNPEKFSEGTNSISRIDESNKEFQKALDNMRKIIK